MQETTRCGRCGMTFRIAEPPQERTERLVCPEAGCARPFWSVGKFAPAVEPRRFHSIEGMTPANYAAYHGLEAT